MCEAFLQVFVIPILVTVVAEMIAWWLIRKFDDKSDK